MTNQPPISDARAMGIEKSQYMEMALEDAKSAALRGEVPVGAVIVSKDGKVLARAGNRVVELSDPTAHAEMLAIKSATNSMKNERLLDCDIYVTLEPCPMCATALSFARVRRIYYGAEDVKSGGVDNGVQIYEATSCHHRPEVYGGISEHISADLLKDFFKGRR